VTLGLGDKVLGLHRMLAQAELPHAFGGALALAFCTQEPRGTKDIDVNVFVGTEGVGVLAAALRPEVNLDDSAATLLRRDAQARLWWGQTPVDVFLSNHPFHDDVHTRVRHVAFGHLDKLPVLACTDLAVFKAFFARPKDVLDVATMASARTVNLDELRSSVATLMGGDAERRDFFAKVADTITELSGG
jgi:hypothetical protein